MLRSAVDSVAVDPFSKMPSAVDQKEYKSTIPHPVCDQPEFYTAVSSVSGEPRCKDYTVGWICALPFEMAAARAMLDETHADLPTPQSDLNISLGSVGGLNIVITCLLLDQWDTTSATMTAAQMLRSFQSIRLLLIVGIGQGVPSESTDIRLGDIVVSHLGGWCCMILVKWSQTVDLYPLGL